MKVPSLEDIFCTNPKGGGGMTFLSELLKFFGQLVSIIAGLGSTYLLYRKIKKIKARKNDLSHKGR